MDIHKNWSYAEVSVDKKFIIYFGVLRKIWPFEYFIKRWDR
jgi:hypothetical protein